MLKEEGRHKDDESRAVNKTARQKDKARGTDGWTGERREWQRQGVCRHIKQDSDRQKLRWNGTIIEQANTQKYVKNQPAL